MRHFLASLLVSILLAIFLGHNIVLWAIIGGAVGTLIDLDHFLLLALYGRKFPRVRNVSVKNLNTEFSNYKSFGVARNASHIFIFLILILAFAATGYTFLLPAVAAVTLHVVMDFLPDIYLKIMALRPRNTCMNCGAAGKTEPHGDLEKTFPVIRLCAACHKNIHKKKNPYSKAIMKSFSRKKLP